MECPTDVRLMLEGLARVWDVTFIDYIKSVASSRHGVVVNWDHDRGVIVYWPAADPRDIDKGHERSERFVITRDDLRGLARDPDYMPELIAPIDLDDRDCPECFECGEALDECTCDDEDGYDRVLDDEDDDTDEEEG